MTSVHQPAVDIGRAAVRLVLDEMYDPIRQPQDIVFEPTLVIRESSTNRSTHGHL